MTTPSRRHTAQSGPAPVAEGTVKHVLRPLKRKCYATNESDELHTDNGGPSDPADEAEAEVEDIKLMFTAAVDCLRDRNQKRSDELLHAIRDQNAINSHLEKERQAASKSLEAAEATINERNHAINEHLKEIVTKNLQIAELQQKLDVQAQKIKEREDGVKGRDDEVEEIKGVLASVQRELASCNQERDDAREEAKLSKETQIALGDKVCELEGEKDGLKSKLVTLRTQLRQHQASRPADRGRQHVDGATSGAEISQREGLPAASRPEDLERIRRQDDEIRILKHENNGLRS